MGVIFLTLSMSLCEISMADSVKFSLGSYYFEGRFSREDRSNFLILPYTMKLARKQHYWLISGSRIKLHGSSEIFNDNPEGRDRLTESGTGDVIFKTGHNYPLRGLIRELSLEAGVKIPVADKDKKLGSGRADEELSVKILLAKPWLLAINRTGYKVRGDTKELVYKDTWSNQLTLITPLPYKLSLGLGAFIQSPTTRESVMRKELSLILSYPLTQAQSLMLYTMNGYTRSSADR
ncbi:MAG: transporter, partial [Gammaproteobacteria bacterium]|nr:transporter [Gammaproteobacteria bacterium]